MISQRNMSLISDSKNHIASNAENLPNELEQQDSILATVQIACARALHGRAARSMILLGKRGAGRTKLLNDAANIAVEQGLLTSELKLRASETLTSLLHPAMHTALQSFSQAGSGCEPALQSTVDLQHELPDLFSKIGHMAKAAGSGWVLLIDELQYLAKKDLAELIMALHRTSQEGLPVLLIGAAPPKFTRQASDAKPYAERLFLFVSTDP